MQEHCACRPTKVDGVVQRWPVLYGYHRGDAYYEFTLRHHFKCGLLPEPVDIEPVRAAYNYVD